MTRAAALAAGPGRSNREDPSGSDVRFLSALGDLQSSLRALEIEAGRRGLAVAPLYLDSPRGSLRQVAARLAHQRGGSMPPVDDGATAPGGTLHLRASQDRAGVGDRMRLEGGRAVPPSDVSTSTIVRVPDLGAALFGSEAASSFGEDAVGAVLLLDALGRPRWLHRPTATRWSTDLSGASALVRAIAGGAVLAVPPAMATAGLVDRAAADLLAGLG